MNMMYNIETLTPKFQNLMHVYLNDTNSLEEFDYPFFELDNEFTDLIHYVHIISKYSRRIINGVGLYYIQIRTRYNING